MHRVFTSSFASVYPLYVAKAQKKGRTQEEVDQIILWLTGFDTAALQYHLQMRTTFAEFFDAATLHPNVSKITGLVCGVRVETVEDPLMQKIRWLDKLVDELARGKSIEKILRA
jgi:hypothetical protein